MSWKSLEQGTSLKPFATALLEHPLTIWQANTNPETNRPELDWPSYKQDLTTCMAVLAVLWQTKDINDLIFYKKVIPLVEQMLADSPLFRQLFDPHIQVSKGHQGLRPGRHTGNVARCLATNGEKVSQIDRFLLRAATFYHDIGKGLSAGIDTQEIVQLQAKFEHLQHSFPNHDFISVLVLEAFAQSSDMQKIINDRIGAKNWQKLLLIIHNHHSFEFKNKEQGEQDLLQQTNDLRYDLDHVSSILLTYIFSFADLNSTLDYRQHWPAKTAFFAQLRKLFDQDDPLVVFAGDFLHTQALNTITLLVDPSEEVNESRE